MGKLARGRGPLPAGAGPDRKALEQQLFESTQRIHALTDALPVGVSFSDDATCQRVSGNPAVYAQFDIPEGMNLSASAQDAVAPGPKVRFFRDGVELTDADLPLQRAVRENRRIEPMELEVLLPNGRRWVAEASGAPIRDQAGTVIAGVSVTVDITERRMAEASRAVLAATLQESEGRFRHLSDSAPVLIWVAEPDKLCSYFNRPWLEFVGRTLEQEVGDGWTQNVHPEDLDRSMKTYATSFDARDPFEMEYRLLHHSGEYRWVLGRGVPRFSGEVFIGYIGSCIDITERREMMSALERARDEAVAASGAKDRFLASLSHELRTPLNPVLLLASEAATNPDLSPAVRAQFDVVRKNVELEARLIDDLLDLTRITQGKLALVWRTLDVYAVLRDAIAIVRGELQEKRIHLSVALNGARSSIRGDEVRLQQIFWNILRNAGKFTAAGGSIAISSTVDPLGPTLVIRIRDTGIGLTPGERERIFDAFAQGAHLASVKAPHGLGGLGLGLTISRMLVHIHSGHIRVESPGPGMGSTFVVELPLVEGEADKAPTGGNSMPPIALDRLGAHAKVLLVEDHVATRAALKLLLARRGYDVFEAGTLAEARVLAGKTTFDLLLSDIGLPDGDGYELMTELRASFGLYGVALTGYGTEEDLVRSAKAGFRAHLTKPVNRIALDGALTTFLATRAHPPA